MDPGLIIQIVALFVLLFLSAFFSSAETSLTTANYIRMRTLADDGDAGAQTYLKIMEEQDKMLTAVLVGNNIVNLSASALITSLTIRILGNGWVGLSTGIVTLLILIFGEISPKTIATAKADRMAASYAPFFSVLMTILTPVIWLITGCSKLFLRLLRIDTSHGSLMTEEDLHTVLDVSHEEGVLETEEHEMLHNLVNFGDSRAKDVMVPRVHVSFVDIEASYDELMELFREDKYTRFPVYKDSTDTVVGIINMKDMLLVEDRESFSIKDIMRDAYYTYENKATSELLLDMRDASINTAIVLDEYGVTAGFLTMEDLLEEIVGDIHDEYDEEEEKPIVPISEHDFEIDGSINLEALSEELKLNLSSEDYDSLGGYIMEHLDRVPKAGDQVVTPEGATILVLAMDKNRVDKVRLHVPFEIKDDKAHREEMTE